MKCLQFERQTTENVIAPVSGSKTEGRHTITGVPLVSLISRMYLAGMKLAVTGSKKL
jgi:hypothetical protein